MPAWKKLISPLFFFSLAYLGAIFPFCYFRHDDWLILGNSILILPRQWSSLWHATLVYKNQEVAWFFRPFFKGGVYLFYQAFELNYYVWLTTLLGMAVLSLWIGKRALFLLGLEKERQDRFVLLFIGTVPFHFGSLAWMGEGMMNVPVGMLLFLSLFCLIKALRSQGVFSFWNLLSVICFVLSLGFKEAAIFHPLFLALFLLTEPSAKKKSLRARVGLLFPHAIAAFFYAIVRLLKMPWNPSYSPVLTALTVLKPLGILVGCLLLPALFWTLIARPQRKDLFSDLQKKGLLLLFFVPSLFPYFGHGFFSPGWLFLPGLYFAWIFSWMVSSTERERQTNFSPQLGITLTVLSLLPILMVLKSLGWWQWEHGQKEIVRLVDESPHLPFKQWVIVDCPNASFPKSNFDRVIGFEAGLYNLWLIRRHTPVDVKIEGCERLNFAKARPDTLVMRWQFPHVTQISPPP